LNFCRSCQWRVDRTQHCPAGLFRVPYNENSILEVQIETMHIFGSYSRGAIEAGGLDIVIVYSSAEESWQQYLETGESVEHYHYRKRVQPETALRKILRKPGEKVDILIGSRLDHAVGDSSKIKPKDLILL
jgi:predicted nucleotidyltransferase